ncbi:MAG: hypothetical protein KF765_12345 [Parvibaculaceae bacterium]|nr:hypothetical protein [Parvibaculaceae bacterium]
MTFRDILDADHRMNCRNHFARRAALRAPQLTHADIERLERRIDRMRPAFEREGVNRYNLTIISGGQFLRVVYDTELKCLVTCLGPVAFEARPFIHRSGEV